MTDDDDDKSYWDEVERIAPSNEELRASVSRHQAAPVKLTFREGNTIRGFQDHCTIGHSCIPPGVEFEVHEFGGGFWLVGEGYGDHQTQYGNGAIYTMGNVTLEDLLNAATELELGKELEK